MVLSVYKLHHFLNIHAPNNSQIQHREIRIFSDSQTAVGIITLNWVSNHYLDVIRKINENISSLKSKGRNLEIVWTPEHSEEQGNEVADRLAKEAAMEAKDLGEETSIVTVQDVKTHARVSIRYKWQQR